MTAMEKSAILGTTQLALCLYKIHGSEWMFVAIHPSLVLIRMATRNS